MGFLSLMVYVSRDGFNFQVCALRCVKPKCVTIQMTAIEHAVFSRSAPYDAVPCIMWS